MRRLPSAKRSPRRSSLTASLLLAGASFGSTVVLSLVTSVVMARVYGIEVIGRFALATAPTGALFFLSTVREQPGLVRLLASLEPRTPRVAGLWLAVFSFSTALTLVAALIVLGGTVFLYQGPVGHPELIPPALVSLAGYLVITNVCWNLDTLLSAFRAAPRLFWIRLHQSVVFLVLLVALSPVMASVWGPIVATIGSWVTSLVHRLVVVRPYIDWRSSLREFRSGARELPEIIRFGLKATPGSIANGVGNEMATWTLGLVSTVVVIGAYTRAWSLMRRFNEVRSRIAEMLFPTLVQRRAEGDMVGFSAAYGDTLRYVTVALGSLASVVGGCSVAIMEMFGPRFAIAATALSVMAVNPMLTTANTVQGAALQAVNLPGTVAMCLVAATVTNAIATLVLTPLVGLVGAASGVVAGPLVATILLSVSVRRHIGTPVRTQWSTRHLSALALAYASGFATARLVDMAIAGPVAILVAAPAGALAFAAVFVAARGLTAGDRQRFNQLWNSIIIGRRRRRASAPESA